VNEDLKGKLGLVLFTLLCIALAVGFMQVSNKDSKLKEELDKELKIAVEEKKKYPLEFNWNSELNEDLKLTDDKIDKIHIVADKETLFSIARQYNTTVTNLKDWNNLTETEGIKAGQKLEIKSNTIQPSKLIVPTGITEHIVQPGESLFKIAWNYNTTVQEILDLNGKTETKIRVGEKLKIKGNSKN